MEIARKSYGEPPRNLGWKAPDLCFSDIRPSPWPLSRFVKCLLRGEKAKSPLTYAGAIAVKSDLGNLQNKYKPWQTTPYKSPCL